MNVVELVDAADLAVRTACVLELLAESRLVPPFAAEAVEGAIAMLDDALSASALLTGGACETKFSGNLNALCWATDSYVAKHRVLSPGSLCGDVEKYLKQVSHQMRLIQTDIASPAGAPPNTGRSAHDERSWPFQVARQFFDALAKTLAQRANAMLRA
jgi:hypothetical protein